MDTCITPLWTSLHKKGGQVLLYDMIIIYTQNQGDR